MTDTDRQTDTQTMLHQDSRKHSRAQGRRHGVDWVDMSTPLLPEVVPAIDVNPVSFYSGGGGLRWVMVWSLKNEANLLLSLGSKS